ncbi:thiol reductase thioredoxin [Rathayibacter sp. AY1F6]|uniref:thioredoxin family protein n=1 Tax=Rathayibacter sp. AY1F6 TaxID=2080560 RepID=UPI000CE90845|nr:thioredoxin family protein [Rathayibacter sp. AY1F6]PPH05771.1 thiol reductase thioredoxin [Rathayibacter sp. AY1F6]
MTVHTLTTGTFDAETTAHDVALISYGASWCGPCRALAPVFASLSEHYPSILFAAVDIEAEPLLARAAGIRSIPTVLLLRRGEVVRRHSGVLAAAALADLAESALIHPTIRKSA